MRPFALALVAVGAAAAVGFAANRRPSAQTAGPLPAPALNVAAHQPGKLDTAVFAGGCFWGIEAVFEHVKGVTEAVSGYAGGSAAATNYEEVSSGTTGHAESVRVIYDPSRVSYGDLLRVFFSVAHDPTQLNRQGPDVGTQYRSAIFYRNADQKAAATAYIAQLEKAHTFKRPIVTQVAQLGVFHMAEDYHQDFAEKNPNYPYIVINDRPKVEHLKAELPELYRDQVASR